MDKPNTLASILCTEYLIEQRERVFLKNGSIEEKVMSAKQNANIMDSFEYNAKTNLINALKGIGAINSKD